jgi:hypothetical protein
MFIFNKIGEKGRTGSAWKQRGWRKKEGGRDQGGEMAKNSICTYEQMNQKTKKTKSTNINLFIYFPSIFT